MENTIFEDIMLATEESFNIGKLMYYMKKKEYINKEELKKEINKHINEEIRLKNIVHDRITKEITEENQATVRTAFESMCEESYGAGRVIDDKEKDKEYWGYENDCGLNKKLIESILGVNNNETL